MAMSARQIAEKLAPSEFMRLCGKITTSAQQKFDVLKVERESGVTKVTVELEDRTKKTVML